MFARRFYPGRFFAPRYWPGPGQSASAQLSTVLDLSLSPQPTETMAMNCPVPKGLRLQGPEQAPMRLEVQGAELVDLDPESAPAIDLHYQPTIELTLEDGHAV